MLKNYKRWLMAGASGRALTISQIADIHLADCLKRAFKARVDEVSKGRKP